MRYRGGLRGMVPQAARERAYAWHPGRERRWRRYPGIQRVGPGGQAVLTFDDGPDSDATPAVLDALDAAGARATFFLLGTQLALHAALGREILARGHEIGLHGHEHHRHDRVDPRVSRDDLARGAAAIEDALGIRCCRYRPPYGKMSVAAAEACAQLGMTPVYWSAWGLDWEDISAERIADVVGGEIHDGAIVLLHDSARYGRRPSAVPTARAIPAIARQARERALSLVTLEHALTVGVGT